MPSDAIVVMDWRDTGCPYRQRAYAYTRAWWEALGLGVLLVDSGGEAFSRAQAFNLGAMIAKPPVLILADADAVPAEARQVAEAVLHAQANRRTVYPYQRYVRLTQGASAALVEHRPAAGWTVEWEMRDSVGALMIVPRERYLDAGGCDPRFTGWGFEDTAWAITTTTLHGEPLRIRGDLLHLWHPWHPDSWVNAGTSETYQDNAALLDRYRDAAGDESRLRALREEADHPIEEEPDERDDQGIRERQRRTPHTGGRAG